MKAAGKEEKQHATVEMELEMENINCQIFINMYLGKTLDHLPRSPSKKTQLQ